jgi:hypothetical protein
VGVFVKRIKVFPIGCTLARDGVWVWVRIRTRVRVRDRVKVRVKVRIIPEHVPCGVGLDFGLG